MNFLIYIFLIAAAVTYVFSLLLDKFPVERLDSWLKIISIGLAGFTLVLGALALITGQKLSDMQANKIGELGNEAAQARKEAEQARLAYIELYKSLQPRKLTDKFTSYLKDKRPQVSIIVLHRPGENEPRDLAEGIVNTLQGVGWRTVSPNARPFKDEEAAVILIHGPFRVSVGDAPGVVIVARAPNPNPEMSAALNALKRAFQEDDIQIRVEILPNVQALFPKGTDGANMIVIIVGQQIIELKPPQITITEDKQ